MLFEVGIPNLMWMYTSWVHRVSHTVSEKLILTSGISSKDTCFKFGVWVHLWVLEFCILFFWVALTLKKTCPEHICYIIWDRNPKFGVWIHLGVAYSFKVTVSLNFGLSSRKNVWRSNCYIFWGRNAKLGEWIQLGVTECHISFLGHCTLDHDLAPFLRNCVRSISAMLFEVGIPNLVCRYILGLRSVTYCFPVTVTDHWSKFYYLRYESQIWCVDAYWGCRVSHTVSLSLWAWPWPLASVLENLSGAYLLYCLR